MNASQWLSDPGTGTRIFCQWNLDSGLQPLMGLRILWTVFCILQDSKYHQHKISQLPEPLLWGEKGKAHTATRQQFLFYQDLTRMTLYNILHSTRNTLMGFWHDCLLHIRHVHAWVHMAHVPVSLERSHSRNSCTQFATQSSASVFHTWNTREGREFFRFLNVSITHPKLNILKKKKTKTIFQAPSWRNKLEWSLGKNPHYHSLRLILKYGFELAKLTRLSRDGIQRWNKTKYYNCFKRSFVEKD